jgi:hypothetical protein
MPVASFMMGAFAVIMMWTLVRALHSGIIFCDGVSYNFNERPRMFAPMAAVHYGGVLLFVWLAASGGIAKLWPLIMPH